MVERDGYVDEESTTDINMQGAPACGRCFVLIARYAPQVESTEGTYHQECYEAWYFRRFGRRPRLVTTGGRNIYRPQGTSPT